MWIDKGGKRHRDHYPSWLRTCEDRILERPIPQFLCDKGPELRCWLLRKEEVIKHLWVKLGGNHDQFILRKEICHLFLTFTDKSMFSI